MASPLLGVAGVNSLLFASYGISKRIISPFPQLSLKEIALAGAMAGAANAILASPGKYNSNYPQENRTQNDVDAQWRCLRSECKVNMVQRRINGYQP